MLIACWTLPAHLQVQPNEKKSLTGLMEASIDPPSSRDMFKTPADAWTLALLFLSIKTFNKVTLSSKHSKTLITRIIHKIIVAYYNKSHTSRSFHVLFLDHGWQWITETVANKTAAKGDSLCITLDFEMTLSWLVSEFIGKTICPWS